MTVTWWTREEELTVYEMWAAGHSDSQIAEALQRSKTAIRHRRRDNSWQTAPEEFWTSETIAKLMKLWAEGVSASQIAKQIGTTRSAILGKRFRLGLPNRPTCASRPRKPNPNRKPKKKKPLNLSFFGGPAGSREPTKIDNKPRDIDPPEAERVSLLKLTENTCRWPIGDPLQPGFAFCGRKTTGNTSYCKCHEAVAYEYVNGKKVAA